MSTLNFTHGNKHPGHLSDFHQTTRCPAAILIRGTGIVFCAVLVMINKFSQRNYTNDCAKHGIQLVLTKI